MMTISNDAPLFTIRIVASELDVHPQTLRLYENRGLITPQRSEGNTRLYSTNDISKIKRIIELSDQGINTVGIKMILDLEEQLSQLENSIDSLMQVNGRLKNEILSLRSERGGSLAVRNNSTELVLRKIIL